MPIEYHNVQEPKIDHKIAYKIELYSPSIHVGGTSHVAMYSGGFWRDVDSGKLICLHRDVESYVPR